MIGTIHFNSGRTLKYNVDSVKYLDNGVIMIGKEGNIFVPYGSIEFSIEKPENRKHE